MSSLTPSSPAFQFLIDDRDLVDADLWAVIDSAATSRSRKPLLAIKSSNHQVAAPRNPRFPSDGEFRASDDGQVVHYEQWSHRRPPKTARIVVVKNPAMDPVILSPCPSALAYSSPGPGRYLSKEVTPVVESPQSPAVDPWRSVDKENLTPHSLSGWFPSVTTFKQYQNAGWWLASWPNQEEELRLLWLSLHQHPHQLFFYHFIRFIHRVHRVIFE